MPFITLRNRCESTVPVITQSMAEMIRPFIPKRYQIASGWSLLYSLDQHGASLKTMYEKTRNCANPCILAIRDSDDQVFGCYSSESFSCQTGYYGTGECFLWKSEPKLKVFPWTGKNDYMILTDANSIAIGGGDGRFGLWLTSDLEKGYSNSCQTFDNDHLSLETDFQCLELEVWGLYI
ncbi:TLD-domain-containing protein [Backusella circina FSU 941]|nr:TLD-domain-containing protein [Backusella circina FSU 941]